MANVEESDNPSSSIQEPFLSKPYSPPPSINEPTISDPDQSQFLQISYNSGPRPFKDIAFLILFLLLLLCTFGFGIFAVVSHNPNSTIVSSFVYDSNSTSCVNDSLTTSFSNHPFPFTISLALLSSSSDLVKVMVWTLVITLILSGPLALFILWLLKRYTKQLVYVSLPFFVLIPVSLNVYWFAACTVSSTCSDDFPLAYRILVFIFVFLVIAVLVWIIYINWNRIELTVKIIGIAAHALSQNLGLFAVLPGLIVGLLVYYVPIVVFLVFASRNGKIVARVKNEEYYCAWKVDSWVPAYYAFAIIHMLWSASALIEAHTYVTSGTIAQWYFNKDGSTPKKSIRNSLRHAFGTSSGTICISGLLFLIVRMVRALVDAARQENNSTASGIINMILQCCVNTLLSAIDFLNKFTINFAAITGEAYCTSAKMSYELLKRNLLSAVFVETVSTRILGGIVFVLSAVYAIAACGVVNGVSELGADSYFVGGMVWVLLIVILGYFVHVVDEVIESVYICYAIDRDRGDVCKQEVHEVYVHLPISRLSHPSSLV
ncbi:CTL-like protein DDB_G0288717 [Impatiens glandulifera]|uniref:CTL-like protein DDB_G0288717 n=1 Tax=Impatiens glandulifera TaxID=253017 RepID=UPI001FB14E8F|nr:CTL-like protein DDB_G0288717 [Impatiens glandulifera]